jgi:branched-subunit amino acid aminotransferase/4-amino-4-deoxychorismate lyase
MTVDVVTPAAFTVDDVWGVRGDWRAMCAAARRLRPDWPFAAAELRSAAEVLRHGQDLLSAVLEQVEVPMTWHDDGRLTFFPHDPTDLATIQAARSAAEEIHTRLAEALSRHRTALSHL